MLGVKFKWKHWYWYFTWLVNGGSLASLGIILIAKSQIGVETGIKNLIFIASTAFILFIFLLVYLVNTMKETRLCKSLIKPERSKHLQWGAFLGFMVVNSYWILGLVANKTTSDIPIYIAMPLVIIFGLLSSCLLTFYEFCVSYDVYYHRNKTQIVHDFFRQFDKSEVKTVEEKDDEEINSENVGTK